MNLTLINWRINPSGDLISELENRKNNLIRMASLLNVHALSDEDLLDIVSSLYEWDKSDIDVVATEIFDTARIAKIHESTDILEFPSFLTNDTYYYYGFIGLSPKGKEPKKNKRHRIEELEELIKAKRLIITKSCSVGDIGTYPIPSTKRSANETASIFMLLNANRALKKRLNDLDIYGVTLKNLGAYKGPLIPLIRAFLNEDKVAYDILGAAMISEYALNTFEFLYKDKIPELEEALVKTKFMETIDNCKNEFTNMGRVRKNSLELPQIN